MFTSLAGYPLYLLLSLPLFLYLLGSFSLSCSHTVIAAKIQKRVYSNILTVPSLSLYFFSFSIYVCMTMVIVARLKSQEKPLSTISFLLSLSFSPISLCPQPPTNRPWLNRRTPLPLFFFFSFYPLIVL